MRSDAAPVAVVGGGFSGVMTAVQLARRGVPALLFDGSGRLGLGVAYSTREPAHLLNVPSGKMSAWPDRPDDFARWLGDDGTSFAERRRFGTYLREILGQARGVQPQQNTVVAAERDGKGWRITTESGTVHAASAIVLAQGNQPPLPLRVGEGISPDDFIHNPWSAEAANAVRRLAQEGGDVLILGTGLTMIDTVLSLDEAGHTGRILALSRRGLVPRAHAPHEPAPVSAEEVPFGDLLATWRWLRRRTGQVGFRAAVDSLRPFSAELWQSYTSKDQRRFLRHARAWWDVHRHRIAPEVAARLAALIAEGRLQVVAGRLTAVTQGAEGLDVFFQRRGGRSEERRVSALFNCTGPLGEMRRTQDPLLQQFLAGGAVRIDDLGIGLHVGQPGRAGERIWAVGPLTKGTYWEMVAVPDIRGQAAAVADDIVKELGA
ncbi:FAD/NAD(P)-binding protein [Sphingomonas arenae]|uniref:FAD/NAD(P)-binding protein n=1 Tax=Sphingomonas arenae TaxID=2812555 RepID=UPI0019680AEB|nr:FAD/NAD(P)-binding protein [Sphingomonas arenae]